MFKNLIKDYFKAHSSIHFSQMRSSHKEDNESYEDSLLSEESITHMFSVNREYEKIITAIDQLE